MNPTILFYTFAVKLSRVPMMISLFFYAVILPILFSTGAYAGRPDNVIYELLTSPGWAIVIGYIFVDDSTVTARNANDGEFLALLFTRPVARSEYIISKWMAGGIAIAAIVMVQLLVFDVAMIVKGLPPPLLRTPFEWANIVLNAFSMSALLITIRSLPYRWGVICFVVLVSFAWCGTIFFSIASVDRNPDFVAAAGMYQNLSTVFFPTIDLFDVWYSHFPALPVVSFVSNVLIYLSISCLIMSVREFFYSNE